MDEPATVFGWLAALALIAAMSPHQVRAIRLWCLAAGVLALIATILAAGVSLVVLLPLGFIMVNGLRLIELRRRARDGAMSAEERELFAHVMRIEDPGRQSRLRDLMQWRDAGPGERLIEQGEAEPPLIYIASGRAVIARDGRQISECGAGEFLGEMSHLNGGGASASVTVSRDMRLAVLDRAALARLARAVPELGRALDAAFNRSLAVKVLRMNEAGTPEAAPPAQSARAPADRG